MTFHSNTSWRPMRKKPLFGINCTAAALLVVFSVAFSRPAFARDVFSFFESRGLERTCLNVEENVDFGGKALRSCMTTSMNGRSLFAEFESVSIDTNITPDTLPKIFSTAISNKSEKQFIVNDFTRACSSERSIGDRCLIVFGIKFIGSEIIQYLSGGIYPIIDGDKLYRIIMAEDNWGLKDD